MKQLIEEFEQITLPITLVCAGNRRKEQNTVRKTKGFSWGPAGLSTALFTGTLMANVLRRAKPLRRAKYLCMEGADKLVSLSLFDHIQYMLFHSPGCCTNFEKEDGQLISWWKKSAQRSLWDIIKTQLGHGSQQGHHACSRNEWCAAPPRPWPATPRRCPRPNRWPERQMVETTNRHGRTQRQLVPLL